MSLIYNIHCTAINASRNMNTLCQPWVTQGNQMHLLFHKRFKFPTGKIDSKGTGWCMFYSPFLKRLKKNWFFVLNSNIVTNIFLRKSSEIVNLGQIYRPPGSKIAKFEINMTLEIFKLGLGSDKIEQKLALFHFHHYWITGDRIDSFYTWEKKSILKSLFVHFAEKLLQSFHIYRFHCHRHRHLVNLKIHKMTMFKRIIREFRFDK